MRDFPSDVGQPPSPVPEFGLGLVRLPRRRSRWCGRRRRASAARYGVDFDTTPIETALNWGALALARATALKHQQKRGGVYLNGANFPRARARRSRATRSASDPARAGWAALRQFLFREFFLESSFERFSQRRWSARPPSPVPEFGLRLVRPPRRRSRWCGRRRRASAARYGVDFDTTPIETALNWGALALARATALKDQQKRGGVSLNGANFSRARARRSRATRSASGPTRSSRLGGASPISFSRILFRDSIAEIFRSGRLELDRRRQFLSLG